MGHPMYLESGQLSFIKPHRLDGFLYAGRIRRDPVFCHVCTSFDLAAARELYMMREDLFINRDDSSVMLSASMCEISEAKREGCCSCALLYLVADLSGEGHFDPDSEREIRITYKEGLVMVVELEIADGRALERAKHFALELFSLPGTPAPWPTIGDEIIAVDPQYETWPDVGGRVSLIAPEASDSQCFEKIREWMRECERDHPYCHTDCELLDSRNCLETYPKRLIWTGTGPKDVKLLETGRRQLRYVALSYCWGKVGMARGLRLSRKNLAQFQAHIPWNDLLATHQDAIVVCHKLGFQYLWIDALCIEQDNPADKGDEIVNMAAIYSNAYLTIAASGGNDGSKGCFDRRRSIHHISVTESDGRKSGVFVRKQIPHVAWDWNVSDAISSARNLFRADQGIMDHYSLFHRGWAFQERQLSRRILHYAPWELVWECLGMTSCECGSMDRFVGGSRMLQERRYTAGIPEDIELRCGKLERSRELARRRNALDCGIDRQGYNDYALRYAMLGHRPDTTEKSIYDQWRDLVSQYSRRNLTFETDALPAIGGLATIWSFKCKVPDSYLAGMWQSDISRSMLWMCVDDKTIARPETYLAPSWSWASIRRTVDWLPSTHTPIYRAAVSKVSCTLTDADNPFGQVTAGHMDVKGLVVHATLVNNGSGWTTAYVRAGEKTLYFRVDSTVEIDELHGANAHAYCLWWSTDVNDLRTGMGFDRAVVLRRHANTNTFSRIGVMELLPVEEWRDLMEEIDLRII